MEWPPFLKGKKSESSKAANSQEFVRAEKPDALDVAHLVALAEKKDITGMVSALDTYYDGWREFAFDRNLFKSPELKALWNARTDIIQLATAGNPEAITAALNTIAGPLSEGVEQAAEHNEARIAETREATPAENRQTLSTSVGEIESTGNGSQQQAPSAVREVNPQWDTIIDEIKSTQGETNAPEQEEDMSVSPFEKKGPLRAAELGMPMNDISIDPEQPREAPAQAPTNEEELLLTEKAPANSVAEAQYAVREAEEVYLAEYKKYHKKLGSKVGNESESVKELERTYNETRNAYQNALNDSAFNRIAEKIAKGEMDPDKGAKLQNRYNRIVTFKEVYKPAAEKRYQARLEAQGEGVVGTFKKGLGWLAQKNNRATQWLEEKTGSKHAARFVRIAGTTVVVGGGAAAAGAFATAGLLGAVGWGTFRIGRSLLSTAIGGAAGEALAQAYGKTIGAARQERRIEGMQTATEDLAAQSEEARKFDFTSIDDFEAYDKERELLLETSDERNLEKLEKEKMLVRALTALGIGAGTSAFMAHLPSGVATVAEASNQPAVTSDLEPKVAAVPPVVPHDEVQPHAAVVPETHNVVPRVPERVSTAMHVEHSGSKVVPTGNLHPAQEVPKASTEQQSAQPPVAKVEAPHESAPTPAETPEHSEYTGPYKEVVKLPEGMDPESPEAVAYLNKAYNPQVFSGAAAEHTPVSEPTAPDTQPEPTSVPEVTPKPEIEPQAPVAQPEVEPQSEAQPELQHSAEVQPKAVEAVPERVAPEPAQTSPTVAEKPSSGTTVNEAPVKPAPAVSQEAIPSPEKPSAGTASATETTSNTPEFSSKNIVMESQAPTHPFTNINSVTIDPSEPHVYAIKGLENGGVLWGGSGEQRSDFVTEYFADPSNRQTTLYVPGIDPAGDPLKPEIIALQADDSGTVNGIPLPGGKKEVLKFPGVDIFSDIIL